MNSARIQTAFRLDAALVERLKEYARRENRSLNNYVETLLREAVGQRPNAATKSAIEEARSGHYAGRLDMSSFDAFMDSVNNIE